MLRLITLSGLFLAGCASQGQRVYVAPSNESITTTTEEGLGNSPVHEIYVINGSTVPITVFGVTLRDCQNIRQTCEPRQMDLEIGPGQRRVVLRIEPRDRGLPFNYRFGYSWRPTKK
jgi:hypothetical protein